MPRSLRTATLIGWICLLVSFVPLVARSAPAAPVAPVATAGQPLMFVENVGQFDDRARFVLQGVGATLFTADDAIWLAHSGAGGRVANIRLRFAGAAARPRLEPFGLLESHISYFRGPREQWRTKVPVWAGLRYRNLYPGVDLELAGANGRLAPRLVARSSADLAAVRLQIDGADTVALGARAINLETAAGPLALPLFSAVTPSGTPLLLGGLARPALHGAEVRLPVVAAPTAPTASAPAANNDSSLIYSTYLGGSASDVGKAIAVDASGYVYVGGNTQSLDFPSTPGAYDPGDAKYQDAFLVKFQPGSDKFVYATYLGGVHEDDHLRSIAVDQAGNAYLTGFTYADDFPTTPGAYDRTCGTHGECIPVPNAKGDLFVTKLNAEGSQLFYSTYIGGGAHDAAFDITIDQTGSAYLAGHSESNDFPGNNGSLRGSSDAFIAKLNPAGSQLAYSRFIGGSGDENMNVAFPIIDTNPEPLNAPSAITLDASGGVYIVGITDSNDFPLAGAQAQGIDTFVAKFSPNGQPVFSTLIGGDGLDFGRDIAVGVGGIHVLGVSTSDNLFPKAGVAYDTTFEGETDMFLLMLNSATGALDYSSWLGGSERECIDMCAMALNAQGDIFITGATSSADFPTTSNAYDRTFRGANDIFAARLSVDGQTLLYGSYVGSLDDAAIPDENLQDYADAIAVDTAGNIYITGTTESNRFPTTADALYGSFSSGGNDAVVLEVATQTTYSINGVIRDTRRNPLAGVAVQSSSGAVAITDEAGRYSFNSFAPGKYSFQPSKEAYGFFPGSVNRTINSDTSGINFVAVSTLAYVPLAGLPIDGRVAPTPTPKPINCDVYEPNEDRDINPSPINLQTDIIAKICNTELKSTLNEKIFQDNYRIEIPHSGNMNITLDVPSTLLGRGITALEVFKTTDTNKHICYQSEILKKPYTYNCSITSAGKYIVRIYTRGKFDNTNPYTLRVTLQ